MHTEEGFFSARDGLRLFWQTAKAHSAAAHVALVHGYAEHLGRYLEVTRALNDAAYTVHSLDCRGHGQSGGKRAHVNKFDEYVSDLEVFLARVNEQAAGKPVFLLGHRQARGGARHGAGIALLPPQAARVAGEAHGRQADREAVAQPADEERAQGGVAHARRRHPERHQS
jgi:pimeloyl-ACP methyl ester carboxylesterase